MYVVENCDRSSLLQARTRRAPRERSPARPGRAPAPAIQTAGTNTTAWQGIVSSSYQPLEVC